ncbi:hypothetical protein F3087_15040 [Nocardia colli]|uniref:DoxX family membrane protein n=1 Tax=Nocardia colli TaxID=2545717 RepID=A0A5N0ELQ9_9NOCA|nr:hypothetical protein [Nocardia colli]KAA8888351.1 hypothetical protein F3087_15040 [Nocardia colli]
MAENALAPDRTSARRPALVLAALLFPMGVLHFVMPKPFDKMVPKALPGEPRNYTYASGVAELGVATALVIPRTRGLGGRLAVLLFLAVFPANLQMTADVLGNKKASPLFKIGTVLRLPLQIPMIRQARKVSRLARNSG